jgi:hypothetical protein
MWEIEVDQTYHCNFGLLAKISLWGLAKPQAHTLKVNQA